MKNSFLDVLNNQAGRLNENKESEANYEKAQNAISAFFKNVSGLENKVTRKEWNQLREYLFQAGINLAKASDLATSLGEKYNENNEESMDSSSVNEKKFIGKDMSDYVRQIWMLDSLEDKKLIALDMLDNLDFKGRNSTYKVQIEKMYNPTQLDRFVSNLSMAGEGLRIF